MTTPGELHLKIGAPVSLTANLSDSLVNGSRAVVHKIQQDFITVLFQDGKIIKIHKYTFSVFNQLMKRNVAARKQFPLKLAFALTVHKSQGLSLDRVEVHCSEINVPGQIGVAIGRATNKKGLRVINSHPRLVTRQPQFIADLIKSQSDEIMADKSCCTKEIHAHNEDIQERYEGDNIEKVNFWMGTLILILMKR